jgi:hypothetical protein
LGAAVARLRQVLPWERVLYANTFAFMILMVSIVVWSSVFHMVRVRLCHIEYRNL